MTDSYWWLPPNFSEHGGALDSMFLAITVIVGVIFVGVEVVLLYFCLKYRKKEGAGRAHYTHGSHRLEVAWTLTPAVVLVSISLSSNRLWENVKTNVPAADEIGCTVRILAERFNWRPFYPGPDGRFDTEDDVEGAINQIVVPAEELVVVKLGSKDVIHSFFVPYLRVKQDAVPGFWGDLWFTTTRPTGPGKDGTYFSGGLDDGEEAWEVACAELCGDSHSNMIGRLQALPRAEFDRWMHEQESR